MATTLDDLPIPLTREEMYLDAIARNGGGGGGGGGSSTLAGLTDVDISNPSDGQTLVYNAASSRWVNGSGGGGGGFTLLEGTYDSDTGNVTLQVTYSQLYTICSSSSVAVIYSRSFEGWSETRIYPVSYAVKAVYDEQSPDEYEFTILNNTTVGGANDLIVIESGGSPS